MHRGRRASGAKGQQRASGLADTRQFAYKGREPSKKLACGDFPTSPQVRAPLTEEGKGPNWSLL